MRKWIAIGECMVELADLGDGTYRRGFAGDTFNAAWYARRRLPEGWTVGYATGIGNDPVSEEMASFMTGEGIAADGLQRIAGRTVGLYMISVDGGERRFSYWRGQSAARCLADDPDALEKAVGDADTIYFSGITLAILPPGQRPVLCDILKRQRARGARIAFDTNLRPALWESVASMRQGMLMGAAAASIVLPSLDDEAVLFGEGSADETIERYHGQGASVIAVKNGGGHLTLWDEANGSRVLPASPVKEVVDTTAAGDSFGGTFVAGVAAGRDLDDAARDAMRVAARVIGHRGALVRDIE